MLPNVSIKKNQFNTGSVPPSPTGVLAIVAASQTGAQNVAASYARDDLMLAAVGYGPLVEYGSYDMQVAQKPVVGIRATTSVAGAVGAITSNALGGTSAVTCASQPFDEYNVLLTITADGTVGVAGITYTTSLDGGNDTSVPTALGTGNTITIPNTGITINLGVGTLKNGASYQFFTTRPMPGNTDLPAAFTALQNTRLPWEAVLFDCVYGTGTVGEIDTWLSGLESKGLFKIAFINTRHKTQPVPNAEDEATFLTAMTNLVGQDASIRVCVGTDAGDLTSTITGISQPRPTALFAAARAMLIPVGEDPAFVGRGPLPDVTIADGSGNPRWHDEDLFPGLDDLRLTALRSFAQPEGPQGVYLNNARMLSTTGSDFVWVQHARCANVAASVSWAVLVRQLSVGVLKQAPDPTTKAIYIAEQDAQRLEGLCNSAIAAQLKKQVVGAALTLSRTDDLSSNTDTTVTGTIDIEALAYLKGFAIVEQFSKSVSFTA